MLRVGSGPWHSDGEIGPGVSRINQEIIAATAGKHYELIWVDKGVYLRPQLLRQLRERASKLIHFTPDTAYFANRSRYFESSANLYDLLVTTKSFEMQWYDDLVGEDKVHLTTQAFQPGVHHDRKSEGRQAVAAFVGLCEPDRERCIDCLLERDIPVKLGGQGWKRFVQRHSANARLTFLGEQVFGEQYVNTYTTSLIGLGLLSKRFPEMHTTRTFEIPACATALATERNADTERFFEDDEAVFFDNYEELADLLPARLQAPEELEAVGRRGQQRVQEGGFDNDSILTKALSAAAVKL